MPASGKMYRYAFSILKDNESAADVVQECLMKIWDKRNKLSEVNNPESWAMRIIRNQCYDWVKMNRYSVLGDKELEIEDNSNPGEELQTSDEMVWLNIILNNIPDKQREIFHLREIEGLVYQDIAEIVGVTLSDVKVSLFRTRNKIKLEMQKIEQYGIAK